MSEVKIRPATVGDVSDIASLAGQLGYPTAAAQAAERLGPLLANPDQAFFVAEAPEGEVIGWTHVYVTRLVESEPFAELGGFVVEENRRGGGVGKKLLAATENWIREQGVAKFRIRSRVDRAGAHAFYERLGFKVTKDQRIFDKYLD
jgi:GNAT superfamily N-acetyltransferase